MATRRASLCWKRWSSPTGAAATRSVADSARRPLTRRCCCGASTRPRPCRSHQQPPVAMSTTSKRHTMCAWPHSWLCRVCTASDSHACMVSVSLRPQVVLCADCVYDRQLHLALLATLRRFVKPVTGVALVVASRRCGSLQDFETAARGEFIVENWGAHYDAMTHSLLAGKKCFPQVLSLRPVHTAPAREPSRRAASAHGTRRTPGVPLAAWQETSVIRCALPLARPPHVPR